LHRSADESLLVLRYRGEGLKRCGVTDAELYQVTYEREGQRVRRVLAKAHKPPPGRIWGDSALTELVGRVS